MKAIAKTDIGNSRDNNEDSYAIIPKSFSKTENLLVLLVADGMGGHARGEVASGMTREHMEAWADQDLMKLLKQNNFRKNGFSDKVQGAIKDSLFSAVGHINNEIAKYGEQNNITLGTTLTLLICSGGEYIAMNIGDSRIYKFGKTKDIQITKDQTLAQREVDAGNLSPEDALTDKKSHKLLQCVGMGEAITPDFFRGKYKTGDMFLLCSDGMCNRMPKEVLSGIAKNAEKSLPARLQEIINEVKATGEKDNITGILLEETDG